MFANDDHTVHSSAPVKFTRLVLWAGIALLFLHLTPIAAFSQGANRALDLTRPVNTAPKHIDPSSAFKVDCNKNGSINAELAKLTNTGMTRGVTILVSGTCKENVLIQGFDRLNLVTTTLGTSINDASAGTQVTVDIEDSQNVSLQGFTINSGDIGVVCGGTSLCYLTGNTIQSALVHGVLVSAASNAVLTGNVIQNNGQAGLVVNLNSSANSNYDTFQGNVNAGIFARQGYVFAATSTIRNNASSGLAGVVAIEHSAIRLEGSTVSGNLNEGAAVQGGSEAIFSDTTVTGSGGDGVLVNDLSFARFSGSTITGNLSGIDVNCQPQFPATRGALTDIGGGNTNCTEP
jgi:hypothetical protein